MLCTLSLSTGACSRREKAESPAQAAACASLSSPWGGAERRFPQKGQQPGGAGHHRPQHPAAVQLEASVISHFLVGRQWSLTPRFPPPNPPTVRLCGRAGAPAATSGWSGTLCLEMQQEHSGMGARARGSALVFLLSLVFSCSPTAAAGFYFHRLPSFVSPAFYYSCLPLSHRHLPLLPVTHTHAGRDNAAATCCSRALLSAAAF